MAQNLVLEDLTVTSYALITLNADGSRFLSQGLIKETLEEAIALRDEASAQPHNLAAGRTVHLLKATKTITYDEITA